MHLFICHDIDLLSLEQALQKVSQQRREQALAYKPERSRKQSLAAYLLLCHALRQVYGVKQLPELAYEEGGKPFLPQFPHIHFNLSHCREAAVCVVDSHPVGVDVEGVRRYRHELVEYVCSKEEMRQIQASDHPDQAFIRLWTMKEATLKLTGEGIRSDLHETIRPDVYCHTMALPGSKGFCTIASWQPIVDLPVTVVPASELDGTCG